MKSRKRLHFVGAALTAAMWVAACGDKKETSPPPTVAEPATPAAKTPDPGPSEGISGQLNLSPANTKVGFVGAKVIGSHDGVFEAFSGTVDFENSDPKTAKVKVEIETASVKTEEAKLNAHLKSPDFFDVEKYPKATFVSTGITGGEHDTYEVRGDLNLHGVTKSIEFPAKIALAGRKVTVSAEFTINRKDFGIVYPGMPDNLIKDDVVIKLSVDGEV